MLTPDWTYNAGGSGWESNGIGDHGYRELKDSGKAQFGVSNSSAERFFIVDYDQIDGFISDLLGWGVGGASKIARVLPDKHPFFVNFYAVSATVEPYGAPVYDPDLPLPYDTPEFIQKDFWKVSAQYEPVDYRVKFDADIDTEDQRFCSFKYKTVTQLLTRTGSFKFEQSPSVLAQHPAIRKNFLEIQLTWHQVPTIFDYPGRPNSEFRIPTEQRVLDLQGKINSVAFLGFYPGTVLFVGCDPQFAKPKFSDPTVIAGDTSGIYTFDINYIFHVTDEGESTLYAPEHIGFQYSYDFGSPPSATNPAGTPAQWDRLRTFVKGQTGIGQLPFLTGDLNLLFKYDGAP